MLSLRECTMDVGEEGVELMALSGFFEEGVGGNYEDDSDHYLLELAHC